MNYIFYELGRQGDSFNLHKWAKNISDMAPETVDTILKPKSGPMRKKIKSVINYVKTMKELNEHGNPSRTAYTIMRGEAPKILGLAAVNVISGKDKSAWNSIWQYAAYQAIQHSISHGMFTNPRFVNWVIKGAKMKPKAAVHHIAGIKGILGRPVYQEIKNSLAGQEQEH